MIERRPSSATLISLGPADEHQRALDEIVRRATWSLCPDTSWTLELASGPAASRPALEAGNIPIVLCDAGWQELLPDLHSLSDPPFLIVTSRLADNRLWSEALNLGAYDVLAKPYDPAEVVRVLSMAWLRWQRTHEKPARAKAAKPRGPAPRCVLATV